MGWRNNWIMQWQNAKELFYNECLKSAQSEAGVSPRLPGDHGYQCSVPTSAVSRGVGGSGHHPSPAAPHWLHCPGVTIITLPTHSQHKTLILLLLTIANNNKWYLVSHSVTNGKSRENHKRFILLNISIFYCLSYSISCLFYRYIIFNIVCVCYAKHGVWSYNSRAPVGSSPLYWHVNVAVELWCFPFNLEQICSFVGSDSWTDVTTYNNGQTYFQPR